jgi:hypothetical protein
VISRDLSQVARIEASGRTHDRTPDRESTRCRVGSQPTR